MPDEVRPDQTASAPPALDGVEKPPKKTPKKPGGVGRFLDGAGAGLKALGKGAVSIERIVGFVMLAAFITVYRLEIPQIDLFRFKVFDIYQQIKPREIPSQAQKPVMVIDLDEESLAEVGQWPWPRDVLAQLVQNALKLGAVLVAFDVVFAEPDRMNPSLIAENLKGLDDQTKDKLKTFKSNDAIFADTIKRSRVVLGYSGLQGVKDERTTGPVKKSIAVIRESKAAPKPEQVLTNLNAMVRNVPVIEQAARGRNSGHGLFTVFPEGDGIIRRVPALFAKDGHMFTALSVEMLRVATGRPSILLRMDQLGAKEVAISKGRSLKQGLKVKKPIGLPAGFKFREDLTLPVGFQFLDAFKTPDGRTLAKGSKLDAALTIPKGFKLRSQLFFPAGFTMPSKLTLQPGLYLPTDANGRIWPYFSEHDPDKYIPAKDILNGAVDPELLRGKMTILGTSAVGLKDIRAIPTEPNIPGVEVHAQIIEAALNQDYLKRPNFAFALEQIVIFVGGLIMIVLVPWLGAKWTFLVWVTSIVGIGMGSWWAFAEHKILIDAAYTGVCIFLLYSTLTYLNYAREEAQKKQVRGAFAHYLSPDMVEQLASDPDKLKLGGEQRELTLLFCDVRGFTTISEQFDPVGLTKLINKLLTPLTNAILERHGTIDKYMGDCIMAFWNAPLDNENHEIDGCRSALAMLAEMGPLNARLEQEARDEGRKHVPLKVGLGLNSGPAVVGNMGSDQRFDYSVLGDTVNLAARLEGQSKSYGMNVVIGASTFEKVEDTLAVIDLDFIRVKGKLEGVYIYGLLGDEEVARKPEFKELRRLIYDAQETYRRQKWDEARAMFDEVRARGNEENKCWSIEANLDVLCDVYDERIEDYRKNPPPADWDGVFVATTK